MNCIDVIEPFFYLFSSDPYIPALLYYTHIPVAIATLVFGIFIYKSNRTSTVNNVLFYLSLCLVTLVAANVLVWVNSNIYVIMFFWNLNKVMYFVVPPLAVYALYTLITGRDISFGPKIAGLSAIAAYSFFTFSKWSIENFDIGECNLNDLSSISYLQNFVIVLSIIFLIITFFRSVRKKREVKEGGKAHAIIFASLLLLILNLSFIYQISYYLDNYEYELYALIGLPVFIGAVTFAIVRYKILNVKLLAAQALVVAIILLTVSELFFVQSTTNMIIVSATLLLTLVFGYQLIKSVKREVEAREKIEKLAGELQVANAHLEELNKQKSEFVSFASHQLRSPLTSILGNSSLLLEGDAGPVPEPVRDIVKTIMEATKTQINVVEDYLNISRIELGTMKYNLVDMDFKQLVEQVMNEQKPNIQAKGLGYSLDIEAGKTYRIQADQDKFKQVLMNIVDNSLKYTSKGSISVSLTKDEAKKVITFKVSDTGVGIRADVIPKLFQKFSRAENAHESNIHGTGLGLFIAKDIMKAHNGRVWAESEGEGKGSQFYVEVPEGK